MKQLVVLAFCLLASGAVFAQNNAAAKKTTAPQKSATPKNGAAPAKRGTLKKNGPAIGGFILDNRKRPFAGVEVFIYNDSSSIVASGYTDATGHYETNSVFPGKYAVKVIYPSSKTIHITGVVIRNGITPINISAVEPEADTTLPFASFVPVPEKKKPGTGAPKR